MFGSCIEDVNHEIYGGLSSQRIFGGSFEEPPPGSSPKDWQVLSGKWFPAREGANGYGTGAMVSRANEVSNRTVEADVALSNDLDENAELLLRVSHAEVSNEPDRFDGYEIAVDARNRQISLSKHVHNFKPLQRASALIEGGVWHHVKVVMAGPRIKVFLDREPQAKIDFNDPDHPLLSGQIGLRSWNANASFKNVTVDTKPVPMGFDSDGVSAPWDSIGSGRFQIVSGAPNGAVCQEIINVNGQKIVGVANQGLNRWGIPVKAGQEMAGSLYFKGFGPVEVALQSADGNKTYASQRLVPNGNWRRLRFSLFPSKSDVNAQLAILLPKKGRVLIDDVNLFDAKESWFDGLPVRKDVIGAIKQSGITFLRYGGTMVNALDYRWKNMVGKPEDRQPYFGHWNPVSWNGFGIFDFLTVCEKAKIRSAFAINAEESPQDAADLADYLTGSASTRWGANRIAGGHPQPYKFDYIEIGNEELLGVHSLDAIMHYAKRFRLIEQAIHRRSSRLKLVCAAWWYPRTPAMKEIFDVVDKGGSAWDVHVDADGLNSGIETQKRLEEIRDQFLAWNAKTKLKAVIFEENGGLHNFQRALGHASNVNAACRLGDFVLVDCAANCLQPFKQNDNGWDQGQIFLSPNKVWLMPPAITNAELAQNYQPIRLSCSATSNDLDVLATSSLDGKHVVLTVINPTNVSVQPKILMNGRRFHHIRIDCLTSELTSEAVSSSTTTSSFDLASGRFQVVEPAHSVTEVICD